MKKTFITKTSVIAGLMFVAATFSVSAKPNQPPATSKTTTVVTTTTTTTTTTAAPAKKPAVKVPVKKYSYKMHGHPEPVHHHIDHHKKAPKRPDPKTVRVAPKHYEPSRCHEPPKQEVIVVESGSDVAKKAATVAVVAAGVATIASISALLAD